MGVRDILPPDLLKEMEESGVKFDENGDVIEENKFLSDADDQTEDEADDQTDDQTKDKDEDDSDDGESNDDESDDDESDEKPEEKKPGRLTLTPRENSADKSKDEEIEALKRRLAELDKKIETAKPKDDLYDLDENDLAKTMRKEVAKFRNMRMQEFAQSVEKTVNSVYPETSFKEIITSNEWDAYQNSRLMGSRVADLYLATIKSEEKDDVVSFFSDFVDRYLPSLSKAKPLSAAMKKTAKEADKPKLQDLAVPEKAKAGVSKPKRSGFDYVETDYTTMLEKAERGTISREDFVKFEEKYFKAEREGRVKTS